MLRDRLPHARLAIVNGRVSAVEGSAALLGPEAGVIHLDSATAEQLDGGFEIEHAADRRYVLRGARRATSAAELVDLSALDLARSGLRFVRSEIEADYRAWHREKAIPFTRIGMISSLINWIAVLVASRIFLPEQFPRAAAGILLLVMPVITAALAISYRPRLVRWMPAATMLANSMAGLVNAAICVWLLSWPDLATGSTCLIGFFGFTIFRLLPWQAAIAVLPYFAFTEWQLIQGFLEKRLTLGTLGMDTLLVLVSFSSGLLASLTIDRISRSGYRQERIVASQREVIDRLQRAELQRQVAERSRGLSEALSRLADTARAPTRLAPGDVIEERYKIVRALGKGGMGQVHEVERLTDGRRVALKTLTGIAHREALARFAREAQVAAELDHPNVVAAIDIGVTASGTLFLVMELVAGASLANERGRYGNPGWALSCLVQVRARSRRCTAAVSSIAISNPPTSS